MFVTPCIGVCKIEPTTQYCKGCGRSLQQITEWTSYTDQQRLEIMHELGYAKSRKQRPKKQIADDQ